MAAAVAMAAPPAVAAASFSVASGGRIRSSSSAALSCSSSSSVFGTSSRGFMVARRARATPSVRVAGVRCGQGNFIPGEHKFLYEGVEKLGPDVWNKTYYPKAADHKNVEKTWYIIDAENKRLGRLATAAAVHIRGKNLPTFTPSVDMGAYVVVINAEKVGVTGKKASQKLYMRHSGRPGGLKKENFQTLQKRIPERIVEHAIRGMLPKGSLGRRLFTHLKVYTGPDHPHTAQKPLPLPISDKRINLR